MRILFWTLVHLGVVLSSQVTIEYNKPVLKLTLPSLFTSSDVGHVIFRYTIDNVQKQGVGVLITEGWQYQTSDVSLDGAHEVSADAVIYNTKENLKDATEKSTQKLVLAHRSAVQIPSPRRIRAVIFRDDFNTFNKASWRYEVTMSGGFNGEFEVYTNDPKNVYTHDGHLYIRPIPTVSDSRFDDNFLHTGHMDLKTIFGECTQSGNNGCTRTGGSEILPPIMSGKIKSVPTLRFGTLEVRARIPSGDWLWPAIWMVPTDRVYGAWPRSGEIDIMESKGNPGASGVGKVTSTLNWGPSADQNRKSTTHGEKHAVNWHTQFHTWRLEWTPDHILTFVDNQQIMSVVPPDGGFWEKGVFSGTNLWSTGSKMAPFDQDFLLIFNVAVGATDGYFPDGNHYGNVTKPWDNHSPHPMLDFWKAQSAWLPTWQGENAALVIDWVEFKTL
ncbi:Beta-1 3-glucan-binding protein [Biomphalaria glabrata]|nr:beta-1; 3-glucan-binding protein-like isoform X3 [Biomphalaria glabrata]